jgi:hypothetical protein
MAEQQRFDWYRAFVKEVSRLRWYILALVAISVGDVLMTYMLLRASPNFYESNPVANWLFTKYNIAGMVFLKFAGVAIAVVLAEYVEHHRPGLGKFVLIFGIGVTATVVIYGLYLYYAVPH